MWERNHLNSFLVSSISFQHLIIPIKKKKNEIFSIQEKKKKLHRSEKSARTFFLCPLTYIFLPLTISSTFLQIGASLACSGWKEARRTIAYVIAQ